MSQQSEIQNLLCAVTDAILAEEQGLDVLLANSHPDMHGFIRLIQRLHHALVGVRPSRRFVRRLRQDLIMNDQRNVLSRVRRLPPRVQIVAGVALVAGFMLISRRRMLSDLMQETQERATAQ